MTLRSDLIANLTLRCYKWEENYSSTLLLLEMNKHTPKEFIKAVKSEIPNFMKKLRLDGIIYEGHPFEFLIDNPKEIGAKSMRRFDEMDFNLQEEYNRRTAFSDAISQINNSKAMAQETKTLALCAFYVYFCELSRNVFPDALVKKIYEETRTPSEKMKLKAKPKHNFAIGDFVDSLQRYRKKGANSRSYENIIKYLNPSLRNMIAHGHIAADGKDIVDIRNGRRIDGDKFFRDFNCVAVLPNILGMRYELECYNSLLDRLSG